MYHVGNVIYSLYIGKFVSNSVGFCFVTDISC